MAALPQKTEGNWRSLCGVKYKLTISVADVVVQDRPGSAHADATETIAAPQANAATNEKASQPATGGAAGKKKKKGKK